MRIEGGDQRRLAIRASIFDRPVHHCLVPLVKPIEIAKRDDAPAKMLRNRRAAVQPLHERAIGNNADVDNCTRPSCRTCFSTRSRGRTA
jgi:hypothetical protein